MSKVRFLRKLLHARMVPHEGSSHPLMRLHLPWVSPPLGAPLPRPARARPERIKHGPHEGLPGKRLRC
jgi:hypothetical protein